MSAFRCLFGRHDWVALTDAHGPDCPTALTGYPRPTTIFCLRCGKEHR